ncbi:MAG: DEAD/DEAH box helicase [Leptolyngbyaceae cyanobacterium]
MQLRDYQEQLVHDLRLAIAQGYRRILVYLPTGGGKTVVASAIVQKIVEKGNRANFILHRDPLVTQTSEKFAAFDIPHGIIKSGYPENPQAPVQICGVQTLDARNLPIPPGITLIDEAHSVSFYRKLQELFLEPDRIILGFTATPFRRGKQKLTDLYQILVKGPEPDLLIRQGHLSPGRYFAYSEIDLSSVGISRRSGDYKGGDLQRALNFQALNQRVVEEYQLIAAGRQGIIFTCGIEHSKAIRDEFEAVGIPCAHIDGETPNTQRRKLYAAQKSGDVPLISSVETLTEGFDQPSVSWLGIVRPTLSHALHVQMLGRGARACAAIKKTDFIVSDFGTGNLQRFGRLEDQVNVTLQPPRRSKSPSEAPTKICGNCSAVILAWRIVCPECQADTGAVIEDVPEEHLCEYLSDEELAQRHHYRRLCRLAYERRYKPGWAVLSYRDRYGCFPADWWSFGAVFKERDDDARAAYQRYLQALATQHGHDLRWVERYMTVEFGEGYRAEVSAQEMAEHSA